MAENLSLAVVIIGQARAIFCRPEVYDQRQTCPRMMLHGYDPDPPYFYQSRVAGDRMDRDSGRTPNEADLIVADKDASGFRIIDECESERRFTTARSPANEDTKFTDRHRRRMNPRFLLVFVHDLLEGSLTTKRAPSILGRSPVSPGAAMFSAQIRPPCASMICFEIESPKPEFWPNDSPSGLSV